MGDRSRIEWTDATWNPIVGCSRVSPGCDHCYAIGAVHRQMSEQHKGLTVVTDDGVDWNGQINVVEHLMDRPLRWQRPRRVFVNSLSDLFHPGVARRTIYRVVATMMCAEQHTFQVLTKRPQRMAELLSDETFRDEVHGEAVAMWPGKRGKPPPSWWTTGKPWPLPNVWWGVSIESNRYAFRADHLRRTPAAVRWVSAEPLLGPLDQLDLTGIDWVVAGGESGPGSRPMAADWVRDLRDRCVATACPSCGGEGVIGVERPHSGGDIAEVPVQCSCRGDQPGVAFHFKQWGDWLPVDHRVELDLPSANRTWAEVGGRATVRVGKAVAGRVLDGRTWDEYP